MNNTRLKIAICIITAILELVSISLVAYIHSEKYPSYVERCEDPGLTCHSDTHNIDHPDNENDTLCDWTSIIDYILLAYSYLIVLGSFFLSMGKTEDNPFWIKLLGTVLSFVNTKGVRDIVEQFDDTCATIGFTFDAYCVCLLIAIVVLVVGLVLSTCYDTVLSWAVGISSLMLAVSVIFGIVYYVTNFDDYLRSKVNIIYIALNVASIVLSVVASFK